MRTAAWPRGNLRSDYAGIVILNRFGPDWSRMADSAVHSRSIRDRRNELITPDRKHTTEYALRIPRHLQCRTDRGGSPARPGTAKYNPVESKDARGAPIHVRNMKLPALHPDRSEFSPIRRDGGLYVDKTGPLRKLLVPVSGDGSRLHTQYAPGQTPSFQQDPAGIHT